MSGGDRELRALQVVLAIVVPGGLALGGVLALRALLQRMSVTEQPADNTPPWRVYVNLWRTAQVVDLFPASILRSAYRTPEVNRMVGGEDDSWHPEGRAFDLVPDVGGSFTALSSRAEALRQRGVLHSWLVHKGHLHAQVNPAWWPWRSA